MDHPSHPVVIVPGLRGDVPDHWQSHLARRLPTAHTVDSATRDKRDLDGRIEDLQAVLASLDGPTTIVAHSAGVLVTVHWALRYGSSGAVRAALLATPPTLLKPLPDAYPTLDELEDAGWLAIPHRQLPFPSIVAASEDDELGDTARVRELAAAWGSSIVDLGPVGHLSPASGYGDWPGAVELLERLDDLVRSR